MPFIKVTPIAPKVKTTRRKLFIQLPVDLVRDLEEYSAYLGMDTDLRYVIEQVLVNFLNADKAFQEWKKQRNAASG